jgi:diguanylate cyclase (GGDEF)-like protein
MPAETRSGHNQHIECIGIMSDAGNIMADWRKDDFESAAVTSLTAQTQRPARPAHEADAAAVASDPLTAQLATLRSVNARLLREIDVLKQREAHALRLADRDGLTGLYNRRRMSELVAAAIEEAERKGHQLGILFVDLDGFKRINDHYGHAAGDELLTTVAGRIASRARTGGDLVSRYGGDEFLILLPRIPSRDAALEVAATLGARVALPCRVAGGELRVTAAIGVSVFPEDGRTAAELLDRADAEMYRVKGAEPDAAAAMMARQPRRRSEDDPKSPW